MNAGGRSCERAGEHPDSGTDLEHDIVRPDLPLAHCEIREVLVQEEMLPEIGVRPQAMGLEQPGNPQA
jgi:hypothetical protein